MGILRNILRALSARNAGDSIRQQVLDGNVSVGSGCRLQGLTIILHHKEKNCRNVVIGNNCMLSGTITIHSPAARVQIADGVFSGHSCDLQCRERIEVEPDVMLSWEVTITDTDAHPLSSQARKADVSSWMRGTEHKDWSQVSTRPVLLKANSWIGFRANILKGVTVGKSAIVGAGSTVTRDIPDYTVWAGNPARFIRDAT